MLEISKSVGRSGVNFSSDVKRIQQLLNQAMQDVPGFRILTVDGIAGPLTLAAIERFQREFLQSERIDGTINLEGATIRALQEKAKSAGGLDPFSGFKLGFPKQIQIGAARFMAMETLPIKQLLVENNVAEPKDSILNTRFGKVTCQLATVDVMPIEFC